MTNGAAEYTPLLAIIKMVYVIEDSIHITKKILALILGTDSLLEETLILYKKRKHNAVCISKDRVEKTTEIKNAVLA